MQALIDTPKFLFQIEVFKRIKGVTGSIVECGVGAGITFIGWAQLQRFTDNANLCRRLIGFDTFKGFPSTSDKDRSEYHDPKAGDLTFDVTAKEIAELATHYMNTSYVREPPRVELVVGDIMETVPKYIEANQHTVVSLLHIDVDLYEPTMCALEHFVPLMPKGAIVLFDELNMTRWPGETRAMFDYFGLHPRLETMACHSAAAILEI